MKKTIMFLLLSLCCTLPPKDYIISPEYKKMDYSDKTLGIYSITSDIMYLENIQDFRKLFKEENYGDPFEMKMAADTFAHYFIDVALHNVKKIKIDTSHFILNNQLKKPMVVSCPLGETGTVIDFKIPNLSRIERNEIQLLLILDKVEIKKEVKEHEFSHMDMATGNLVGPPQKWNTNYLILTVPFIIWDYEEGKAVCYGLVREKQLILLSSRENWIGLFKKIPQLVFNKTPFKINIE